MTWSCHDKTFPRFRAHVTLTFPLANRQFRYIIIAMGREPDFRIVRPDTAPRQTRESTRRARDFNERAPAIAHALGALLAAGLTIGAIVSWLTGIHFPPIS